MAKQEKRRGTAEELLARGADGERRLLKRERRAERVLAEAHVELADEQARLARVQSRIERASVAVEAAETELRLAQQARAQGPDGGGSARVEGGGERSGPTTPDEGADGGVVVGDGAPSVPVAETIEEAAAAPVKARATRRRTARGGAAAGESSATSG